MKPEIEAIRNRRKLVAVPHNRALQLLFSTKVNQTHVLVPSADLPEGAHVLGVYMQDDQFVFEICHESFDEFPETGDLPFIDVTWDVLILARPEPDPKPFPPAKP